MHQGMELLRCLVAQRALRLAPKVLALGWLPLLLYVGWEWATGSRGGNPIGLGLLLVAATLAAVLLAAVGSLQGLVRFLREAR
jgi:hypothetical protein